MSADVSEAVERLIAEAVVRPDLVDKVVAEGVFKDTVARILAALQQGSGALPASPSGGQWHGPKCWGRTSFSDEVAHCYCQKATVTLIDREYSEELCDRLKLVADRVDGTTHLHGELVSFKAVFDRVRAQLERFTAPLPDAPSMGMEPKAECAQPSRSDILERIRAFDLMAHYGEAEYERLADDLEALAQPNQPRDREEG